MASRSGRHRGIEMNVNELVQLANWFAERHPKLSRLYAALQNPVQHNASQPNKQPLEEQLKALTAYLRSMSFEALSLEQIAVLEARDVAQYLGPRGAAFVDSTIRVSDYDPATAVQKLQNARAAIDGTLTALNGYETALAALEVDLQQFEEPDDFITIRVGFRRDASIDNVVELKRAANDWHEIIRGVSRAVGEAPESTKVVGAGTGSIILILASTAVVTFLLARISKHLTGVAHDIISVESARARLKRDKMLTEAMDAEFKAMIKEKKESAHDTIMEEAKKDHPDMDGDAANALSKAVTKLLAFNRKGGDLDFVAPTTDNDEESDEESVTPATELLATREAIEEYHRMRDELRLLTDQSANDNAQ